MKKWQVTFGNMWGSFPGRLPLNGMVVTVQAPSYGEAVQRASRKVMEDWFSVSVKDVSK